MRVRVGYTIDLEEIPQKVCLLIDDLQLNKLNELSKLIRTDLLEKGNISSSLEKLQEIRNNLLKIDVRTEDCIKILVGYQKYLSEMNNPPAEDEEFIEQPSEENV